MSARACRRRGYETRTAQTLPYSILLKLEIHTAVVPVLKEHREVGKLEKHIEENSVLLDHEELRVQIADRYTYMGIWVQNCRYIYMGTATEQAVVTGVYCY